jgi:hypothetical protein
VDTLLGDMMIQLGRLIRTKLTALNIDVPITAYVTGTYTLTCCARQMDHIICG